MLDLTFEITYSADKAKKTNILADIFDFLKSRAAVAPSQKYSTQNGSTFGRRCIMLLPKIYPVSPTSQAVEIDISPHVPTLQSIC